MKHPICFAWWLSAALTVTAHAEQSADPPLINPQVVNKLIDMGDYLRSLPAFEVQALVTRDTVLETGQKIKLQARTTLVIQGRDRLYARTEGDERTRQFFYDGKKLTQYSPYLKFYTTIDAPATVAETLHQVEQFYDVEVPLEDLFLFGRDQAQIDALHSAAYVGPSTIDGKLCDHLAFRQDSMDWQLWITRAEKPLPCRLVITTTTDPSFPEYSATYSWNLHPALKPAMFRFTPQKDDVAIALKKISPGAQ